VCADAGVDLRAAAMQYPLRFAPVAAVVVGMATPEEVGDNVARFTEPIDDAVWEALDAV
jgi:D-threo-aldose 1-dehydrogenase